MDTSTEQDERGVVVIDTRPPWLRALMDMDQSTREQVLGLPFQGLGDWPR